MSSVQVSDIPRSCPGVSILSTRFPDPEGEPHRRPRSWTPLASARAGARASHSSTEASRRQSDPPAFLSRPKTPSEKIYASWHCPGRVPRKCLWPLWPAQCAWGGNCEMLCFVFGWLFTLAAFLACRFRLRLPFIHQVCCVVLPCPVFPISLAVPVDAARPVPVRNLISKRLLDVFPQRGQALLGQTGVSAWCPELEEWLRWLSPGRDPREARSLRVP